MWILRTDDPDDAEGLTFRMLAGSIKTIGRATRADFILDRTMVSRLHCRLTATPSGQLEVEDLASTNGTFLNGRRVVRRTALADGDRLRVGRVELVASKLTRKDR